MKGTEELTLGQYINDRIKVYNLNPETKGEGRLFDSFDVVGRKPVLSKFPEEIQDHVRSFQASLREEKLSINTALYHWVKNLYSLVTDWITVSIKEPEVIKSLEEYLKKNNIKDFIGGIFLSITGHVLSCSTGTLANSIAFQPLSTLIGNINLRFYADKLSDEQSIKDAINSPFILANKIEIEKMIESSLKQLTGDLFNKILNSTSISVKEIKEIRAKLSPEQFSHILDEMKLYLIQNRALMQNFQLANISHFLVVSGELNNPSFEGFFKMHIDIVINSIAEDKNFGKFYPYYIKAKLVKPIINTFLESTNKKIKAAASVEDAAKIVGKAKEFLAGIEDNDPLVKYLYGIISATFRDKSRPTPKVTVGAAFLNLFKTETPVSKREITLNILKANDF